jgi:serine/threonine-protein kinase
MAISTRFEVKESMGEGGFARVFHASELATGRDVALKVLKSGFLANPEVVERFQREVFAVASISSPNIVAMYDFGFTGEEVFIAMEFVGGATLRELIAPNRFTAEEVASIIGQIAAALAAAHKQNVVHRDLKPENVKLVRHDGTWLVKVLDFGMAKLLELEQKLELEPITRAGVCFGTPQYMAPEQIRGVGADEGVDLFALGVMAYELVGGARPWDGNDPYEVMRQVVNTAPPLLTRSVASPDRLPGLNRFFRHALAKNRCERPADATAFARELRLALLGDAALVEAAPAVVLEAPRPEAKGRNDVTVQTPAISLGDTGPQGAFGTLGPDTAKMAAVPTVQDSTSGVTHAESTIAVAASAGAPKRARSQNRSERRADALSLQRSSFRAWVLPFLLLALFGTTVGYFVAGAGSAQANEIHDWLVRGSK